MKESTGLPFEPQSIEAMRARVPAALERVVTIADAERGKFLPGQHRTHVFDFEDGIRLVLSRDEQATDRKSETRVYIHASLSMVENTQAYRTGLAWGKLLSERVPIAARLAWISGYCSWLIFEHLDMLAVPRGELAYFVITPGKGIPHAMFREA